MFKRGQAFLEYLLLLALVAGLALVSFRPGGVIGQTVNASKDYYKTGTIAILSGFYDSDGRPRMQNPNPINGGWCERSACINGYTVRECACPRPAFGGTECAGLAVLTTDKNGNACPDALEMCDKSKNLHYIKGYGCGCFASEHMDSSGKCVTCPSGTFWCGESCVDLMGSDPMNCGGCAVSCGSDSECQQGSCVCSGSKTKCDDGSCYDLNTDPQHCGQCSTTCQVGESCISRVCCSGNAVCNGVCVDTKSDPNNCGGCGNGNQYTCSSGSSCCSGTCADLASDSAHCGSCSAPCGAGKICSGSNCCPNGQHWDRSMCCPSNTHSSGGLCCPNGSENCGSLGVCIDLSTASNCGSCGNVCSSGTCSNRSCTTCQPNCPAYSSCGPDGCGGFCKGALRDDRYYEVGNDYVFCDCTGTAQKATVLIPDGLLDDNGCNPGGSLVSRCVDGQTRFYLNNESQSFETNHACAPACNQSWSATGAHSLYNRLQSTYSCDAATGRITVTVKKNPYF